MEDGDAEGLWQGHLGWDSGQAAGWQCQRGHPESRLLTEPGLGLTDWEARRDTFIFKPVTASTQV